jgi:hypothetical protein
MPYGKIVTEVMSALLSYLSEYNIDVDLVDTHENRIAPRITI